MMTLLPELSTQLRDRATELARAEHSRRSRSWRVPVLAVGGTLVLAAGASAALGLWSPELGTPGNSPTPTAQEVSTPLVDELNALRRAQTEQDRALAAQYALKFPADPNSKVQTNAVRELSTTSDGNSVVLVPMLDPSGAQEVCLWVGTAGQGGGRTCGTASAVADGELLLGAGTSSADSEATLAEARRRLAERRAAGDRSAEASAELEALANQEAGKLTVVGVAPDGASKATVSGKSAAVRDNVFEIAVPEAQSNDLKATFE